MVHFAGFRADVALASACLVGVVAFSTSVSAQQIYKSINENGVVEYSTIPPSGDSTIETLAPLAEPTEAEIRAAQNELDNLRRSLEERARERREALDPVEPEPSSTDAPAAEPPRANPLPAVTPFL